MSIESRVIRIVAEALDVKPSTVELHSSLIDDLGAESIDFLDVLFRIETEFSIRIQENEIWRGSIQGDDPESIQAAVARLKAKWPAFRWDRFPGTPTKADLPRLITVQTIVDYLRSRQGGAGSTTGAAG
jgi:acyl carrier protein